MKRLKISLKIFISILLLLIILRAPLYRLTVKYETSSEIDLIPLTDKKIIDETEDEFIEMKPLKDNVLSYTLNFTKSKLKFARKSFSDPNKTYFSRKANCVGYAALFNSVGNFIIQRYDLSDQIEIKHLRGKLYFFGKNVHELFNDPFFKDHDYNVIIYKTIKDRIYIDPVVADYLFTDKVSIK